MKETAKLVLREKPLFEIQIQEHGFTINNDADKNDNGLYEFEKIDDLKFEKKRINWFVSISSFIVDLFSGSATGGIFKEKNQLKFKYNTIDKRILLDQCDVKKTEKIVQEINRQVT